MARGFRRARPTGFTKTKGMPSAGPKARSSSKGVTTNIFRKPTKKGFK